MGFFKTRRQQAQTNRRKLNRNAAKRDPDNQVSKPEPVAVTPEPSPEREKVKKEVASPTKGPTPEVEPLPEVVSFCCLCLRKHSPDQFVIFSAEPTWNCLDVTEVQEKLTKVVGLQIELEKCALCRSCWTVVELLADFRECCRKAAKWRDRFDFGIETVDESSGWLSRLALKHLEKTRRIVQDHIESVEKAEIEARNRMVPDEFVVPEVDLDTKEEPDWTEELYEDSNPVIESQEEESQECSAEKSVEMVEEIKEIKVHACTNCQRRFEGKNRMIIHMYYCKKSANKKGNTKFYTCSICTADFVAPALLRDHENKHKGIKPYKCRKDNCNRHFYTNRDQIKHENICGQEKPVCSECGFQAASADSLKAHLERHKEPSLPCEECGKLFKSRTNLRKHRKVHSDERNWKCDVCGKGFKSSNAAHVHKRIHTQEKPFSCPICGQGFAYKCLVKPHMKKCQSMED